MCVGLIVVRGVQYVNLQLLYNNNENNDKSGKNTQKMSFLAKNESDLVGSAEKYVEFLFLKFIKLK